jgi:hypothetical protein
VVKLIEEIGAQVVERRGNVANDELKSDWDVAIATPRRLMELNFSGAPKQPLRIAFLDGDARTAHAMLQRTGVDMTVRRPVHPMALRLLILHTIYRGPEKRKLQRVSVGTAVSFRMGLRKRNALLADISRGGCLLISSEPLLRGKSLKLTLSSEVTGGRTLSLAGKVIRCGPAPGGIPGVEQIAIGFEDVSSSVAKRLATIVKTFAKGPAVYTETDSRDLAALESLGQRPMTRKRNAAVTPPPSRARSERREIPRAQIPPPATLSAQASKVLVGRDISLKGMRIEPNASLSLGDEVRIAVHIRTRKEPFVVDVRVERDDGAEGLLLGFHNMSDESRTYLAKMVNFLPILAARGGAEGESGMIVSEIIPS